MTEQEGIPMRTVAFLDILGFRAKLLNTPLFELARDYERRILESRSMNRPFDPTGKAPTLFRNHPDNFPWCAQYVEAFVQRGRLYVKDQSNLPVELRSYYIGAKFPPFEHGDDL